MEIKPKVKILICGAGGGIGLSHCIIDKMRHMDQPIEVIADIPPAVAYLGQIGHIDSKELPKQTIIKRMPVLKENRKDRRSKTRKKKRRKR